MKTKWLYVALLAAVLFGALSNIWGDRKAAKWKADRDRVSAVAAMKQKEVDSLRLVVLRREAFIDSSVVVTAKRDTLWRTKVITVGATTPAAVLPDTCRPAILQRDSLLADAGGIISSVTAQRDSARVTIHDQHVSIADLQWSADSLKALVNRAPVGRSFWSKILPDHMVIGAQVGMDPITMKPYKGVGVTLGWQVF